MTEWVRVCGVCGSPIGGEAEDYRAVYGYGAVALGCRSCNGTLKTDRERVESLEREVAELRRAMTEERSDG